MGAAATAGTWVAPSIIRLDPVAAATGSLLGEAYFLHNDPTPPSGDTSSQLQLPLNQDPPTESTLHNYDNDRDAFPGLLLQKGTGLTETDPNKYQTWRTGPSAKGFSISGTVTVRIWTAMKDFAPGKAGVLTAGIYDCNASDTSCSLVASGTTSLDPWPSAWSEVSIDLGSVSYAFRSSRRMMLKVAVLDTSDDDLWLAYDTTTYNSCLTIT